MEAMEVLDEEAIKTLQQQHGLICPVASGKGSGSISVSSSSYMSVENINTSAVQVDLPVLLNSMDTLRFLEIQPEHAVRIWASYQATLLQGHDNDDYDLLQAVKDHVLHRIVADCGEESDDWIGLWTSMGMASTFIERVMDPQFSHMRLMSTAKKITQTYLEDRWQFLQSVGERIRAPEQKAGYRVVSIGKKSEPITRSGQNDDDVSAPSSPSARPLMATGSTHVDGHKILYKSGAQTRLEKVVGKDGALNFATAQSSGTGDFSPLGSGLYFTSQYAVAYEYAKWAAKIVNGDVVPVGILQVAVPMDLLSSSYEVVGAEWKGFVHTSRKTISDRFTDFAHLEDYKWLIGAVCHTSQKKFDNNKVNKDQDVETWKLPTGETATQHFTNNLWVVASLDKECRGKVWISTLANF